MTKKMEVLNNPSNDTNGSYPFTIALTIRGNSDLLFHRWSNEAVEEKANAAKGSKTKKEDNVESYVYRDDTGRICIPSRYLIRSIVEAARFHQDPRSTRKMAKELVQAAVVSNEILTPILVNGEPVTDWDYLDRQRVVIQRNAITRARPAFRAGWEAKLTLTSLLHEYVTETFLMRLVDDAGKFVGVGDFRPSYGRFVITSWEAVHS